MNRVCSRQRVCEDSDSLDSTLFVPQHRKINSSWTCTEVVMYLQVYKPSYNDPNNNNNANMLISPTTTQSNTIQSDFFVETVLPRRTTASVVAPKRHVTVQVRRLVAVVIMEVEQRGKSGGVITEQQSLYGCEGMDGSTNKHLTLT